MAISDATKVQRIYQILGMPQKTSMFAALALTSMHGPRGETFDLEAFKTAIDAALAAASTAQESEVDEVITAYRQVWLNDLRITESGGDRGRIIDHDRQMDLCRRRVAVILGVYVPPGGIIQAFERIHQQVDPYSGSGGGVVTR